MKSQGVPRDAPSLIASGGMSTQSIVGNSSASNTRENQMPREEADYYVAYHLALHELSPKVRERVRLIWTEKCTQTTWSKGKPS